MMSISLLKNFSLSLLAVTLSLNAPLARAEEWKSAEAKIVEQAKMDALIQGKKILIDIGAGWCGPCASLDKFFAENEALLKPALDQYIFLHIEELHLEINFLSDFMPYEVFDYPNLVALDPSTGKADAIPVDTDQPMELIKLLTQFTQGEDTAALMQDDFRKRLAQGENFGNVTEPSSFGVLYHALISTAVSKTPVEFATFVVELKAAAAQSPAQFVFDTQANLDEYYLPRMYDMSAGRADFDLSAVQAIDPKAFADFTKGFSVFYGYVYDFQVQLGQAYRKGGIALAASSCMGIKAVADTRYSGRDYYDGGSALTARLITCTELEYLAGTLTKADAIARFDSIVESERDAASKRSSGLMAILGEYGRALDYLEKSRTRYMNAFKSSPTLMARIGLAYDKRKVAYEAGKTHP